MVTRWSHLRTPTQAAVMPVCCEEPLGDSTWPRWANFTQSMPIQGADAVTGAALRDRAASGFEGRGPSNSIRRPHRGDTTHLPDNGALGNGAWVAGELVVNSNSTVLHRRKRNAAATQPSTVICAQYNQKSRRSARPGKSSRAAASIPYTVHEARSAHATINAQSLPPPAIFLTIQIYRLHINSAHAFTGAQLRPPRFTATCNHLVSVLAGTLPASAIIHLALGEFDPTQNTFRNEATARTRRWYNPTRLGFPHRGVLEKFLTTTNRVARRRAPPHARPTSPRRHGRHDSDSARGLPCAIRRSPVTSENPTHRSRTPVPLKRLGHDSPQRLARSGGVLDGAGANVPKWAPLALLGSRRSDNDRR